MAEAFLYEKRSSNLDDMTAGIRMAALISGGSARHEISMANDQAIELARIIEQRDQVRVVKVKEEVYPVWFLSLMGTLLMSSLVSDAALFLSEVLR